jgi:hypothetical protein
MNCDDCDFMHHTGWWIFKKRICVVPVETDEYCRTCALDEIIDEWRHFCDCINFGSSALDARAITFMNTFEKKLMDLVSE